MTIVYGILTALLSSTLFYFAMKYVDKKNKKKRVEIKIIENKLKIKVAKEEKPKIILRVRLYYALLFFLASLVAFYERSMILMTIYSLIIFTTGLLVGSYILVKYAKRSIK